jgi:hypothetical protein
MGVPRYHDQQTLLLIYRTITNLEHINERKSNRGPFEVTQLISSFQLVYGQPWDQLLDKEKLVGQSAKLSGKTFMECQFPTLYRLPVKGSAVQMANIHDYLRVLRNATAHGNFELLDRKTYRQHRQQGPTPSVKEKEIAGLLLWNTPMNTKERNWEAVLNVRELTECIYAMQRLCEKRSLWIDDVRTDFEERERQRERMTG